MELVSHAYRTDRKRLEKEFERLGRVPTLLRIRKLSRS